MSDLEEQIQKLVNELAPERVPDPGVVYLAGRRQRLRRHSFIGVGAAAFVAGGALLVPALGGGTTGTDPADSRLSFSVPTLTDIENDQRLSMTGTLEFTAAHCPYLLMDGDMARTAVRVAFAEGSTGTTADGVHTVTLVDGTQLVEGAFASYAGRPFHTSAAAGHARVDVRDDCDVADAADPGFVLGVTGVGEPEERFVTENFPTNGYGETYGSSAGAESADELPDLIAVMNKSGQGFVRKEDFAPVTFLAAPAGEDPAAYQERLLREGKNVMPMFALDGRTRIGTWRSGGLSDDGIEAGYCTPETSPDGTPVCAG